MQSKYAVIGHAEGELPRHLGEFDGWQWEEASLCAAVFLEEMLDRRCVSVTISFVNPLGHRSSEPAYVDDEMLV